MTEPQGSLVFCESDLSGPFRKKPIQPGKPNEHSGWLAFAALQRACDFALNYSCRGLLTAPVSKEWIVRSGQRKFRGHTDYLAERFGCEVLMLMHGAELSIIPLTVHIPLLKVPRRLKQNLGNPALVSLLKRVWQIPGYERSLWALCGLNPHAGENGLIGSEEKFLRKWCQKLYEQGLPIEGPLPADALFMSQNRRKYRLILSCYHDQGLIPFKALEGSAGINCTIGLPFLRTSPDHGTAFTLTGSGRADAGSMCRALDLASGLDVSRR